MNAVLVSDESDYMSLEPGSMQCADIHILMVDRDKLDQACQLTAASVSNKHEKVVVDIMTSIIDDRVRDSSAMFTPIE